MPTVLRLFGFRFFFYSNEGNEPPHIHVRKGGGEAKFWLIEVALASNHGFSSKELKQIRNIVLENRDHFIASWEEYFGN